MMAMKKGLIRLKTNIECNNFICYFSLTLCLTLTRFIILLGIKVMDKVLEAHLLYKTQGWLKAITVNQW